MNSPEGPSFPAGLLSGGASPSGDEGFFPFVLERRDSFLGGGPGPEEPEDLAVQLQQKEKDLLLAAELGKMLLERNEELQRQLDTLSAQHAEREEVSWRRGQGWGVEGRRQRKQPHGHSPPLPCFLSCGFKYIRVLPFFASLLLASGMDCSCP